MKAILFGAGLAILAASAGLAQSGTARPTFEVASVKPASPDARGFVMNGGPLPVGPFNQTNHDPGRIVWSNIWLLRVIQVAYDFPVDRISGPGWLNTQRFDILATIPAGATAGDFRLMLQDLLAERFKLVLHRQTREVSGYALVIAGNGPKIGHSTTGTTPPVSPASKESKTDAAPGSNALMEIDQSGFPAPRPGNPLYPPGARFEGSIRVDGMFRVTGLNEPMQDIADLLGRFAGMPVEDETGLTGKYGIHLEFAPNAQDTAGKDSSAVIPDAGDPRLDLFSAVQSQLGLKLAPKKVPVQMLIVDHAEKVPTEN